MKIHHSIDTESMTITLSGKRSKESSKVRPKIVLGFGYDHGIARVGVLKPPKVITNAREIQFAVGQ